MENTQAPKVTSVDQKDGIKEMKKQPDPDWQSSKSSVRERQAVMFNNELQADVHFIVGSGCDKRRIPAHKYMLFTGSSVFYAMFCSGLAEEKEEIIIPDVEPQAFLNLLKYIYCDDISLEEDTVLSTLYTAKKYIVPHLARACVEYLETNVNASNTCLLLSQSRLFDEPELMQRCLVVIDAQTKAVLQSDGFTQLDRPTLELILCRDTLFAEETLVYAAAMRWAQAECTRQGCDPSPQQRREVLGDALYLLRIPTMTLDEFANGVGKSGILSKDELIDLFFYFTAKDKPKLRFPTVYRNGRIMCCLRFQSTQGVPWNYGGKSDSIQFVVDKDISVVGFGLYGSCDGPAEYQVRIALKGDGKIPLLKQHNMASDGSDNTVHVFFDNPVQVKANKWYTATLDLRHEKRGHRGTNGLSTVTCGDVNFTFINSSESTNGTGTGSGQIPEILFRC